MAEPITWRNVNSRGTSEAATLLRGAGDSLNAGFNKFNQVIEDRRNIQKSNFETQGQNNTDLFKDKLASYTTPEALQAAQDSGELAAFKSSLGLNIDSGVARDGADERVTALRDQANTDYDYNQNLLDQQASPVAQKILAANQSGDYEGAQALINANEQLLAESGDLSAMQENLRARTRQDVTESNADTNFANSQTTFDQGQEDRTSRLSVADVVSDAVANNNSITTARQAYVTAAENNNISGPDRLDGMDALNNQFKRHYGMSDAQMQELDLLQNSLAVEAQGKTETAEAQWQQDQSDYPVNPRMAFTDDNRKTLGDAQTLVKELGWDGSSASKRVAKVKNDFLKQNPSLTNAEKADLDSVMYMAVDALGTPGTDIIDNNDVKVAVLKANLTSLWDQYMSSESNRVERKSREGVYLRALDSARTNASQTYNTVFERVRKDNGNRNSIFDTQ